MKIYKFGGASVRNAQGVMNVLEVLRKTESTEDVILVVSAMGKTTNALERVVDAVYAGDLYKAEDEWNNVLDYHREIAAGLSITAEAKTILAEATERRRNAAHQYAKGDYDQLYDQIVSLGEWISTKLIAAYFNSIQLTMKWIEMASVLRTDDTFRDAKVDFEVSKKLLLQELGTKDYQYVIVQGFIGGTADGRRTTLGREGSDYTAALVGAMTGAESVTIWKDVPGILNADPRLVENTVLIPELSYKDAVELAYSGAQVIHPKTIRPLYNASIPLYVKPFGDPCAAGSVIHANPATPITVPIYIWRKNQLLITMRAKDFSFALEESLNRIFEVIHRHRLKVSLIQSSAVSVSVCVDNSRYVQAALEQLREEFSVAYNEQLSLLTVRGTTPEILQEIRSKYPLMLSQTTRRTARFVVHDNL